MKIIPNDECKEDFAGRYPVCELKGAEFAKIYDLLWERFNGGGYKFAIIFDLAGDEYGVPEDPKDYAVNVHFLDDLFDEIVEYMGVERCEEALQRRKDKRI